MNTPRVLLALMFWTVTTLGVQALEPFKVDGAAYSTDFIYHEYPAKEEFNLKGGVRLVILHRGAR